MLGVQLICIIHKLLIHIHMCFVNLHSSVTIRAVTVPLIPFDWVRFSDKKRGFGLVFSYLLVPY